MESVNVKCDPEDQGHLLVPQDKTLQTWWNNVYWLLCFVLYHYQRKYPSIMARPLRFDPDELNDFFATTAQRTLETRATPIEDLTCLIDNLP